MSQLKVQASKMSAMPKWAIFLLCRLITLFLDVQIYSNLPMLVDISLRIF